MAGFDSSKIFWHIGLVNKEPTKERNYIDANIHSLDDNRVIGTASLYFDKGVMTIPRKGQKPLKMHISNEVITRLRECDFESQTKFIQSAARDLLLTYEIYQQIYKSDNSLYTAQISLVSPDSQEIKSSFSILKPEPGILNAIKRVLGNFFNGNIEDGYKKLTPEFCESLLSCTNTQIWNAFGGKSDALPSNGRIFKGQENGFGILEDERGVYIGYFKGGRRSGEGIQIDKIGKALKKGNFLDDQYVETKNDEPLRS